MRGASIAAAVLVTIAAVGCSTSRTAKEGRQASSRENWDAAVYHYLELVAKDPENVEYRVGLTRARQKAAQEHFQRGLTLRRMGQLTVARNEIEMAIQLDPTHQYAEQILEDIEEEIEILSRPGGAEELEELKRQAREAKVKPPVLDPKSDEAITLSFPKAKSVKEIYRAMGKAYGFNVIFDPNLRDDKLAIELKDVDAERALELVMQHSGHFYKVLDEHTIIIAEDTPQKRREYEDLVIKTFFLSNADVKEVDKLLRSLIEARRLSTNEQLNAITLRDTADKVAIAERLIAINDKAKAEVLVDVELLEVDATKTSEFGMNLSTYAFTLQTDLSQVSNAPSGAFLDDLSNIDSSNIFVNVPSIVIKLVKSSGNATLLAQPQLRITEGEQAQLHLGDRVPIPVTSFNTGSTGAGGIVVPITSFQYQDIGIRIEVEPRVHHNREVTLNLMVEVSQLGETVPVGPDQEAVTIGTRTIQSTIRLKSGESSLLAGLLQKSTTEGESKTPLLSDIPGIGRLFTNKKKSSKTSDLVLTLTPHIIRFPDIQEEDLAPVWVGTESRISFSGSRSPRVQSGRTRQGPFDPEQQRQRTPTAPSSSDPDDNTPYGARRPRRATPPQPRDTGVELVPRSNQKSLGPDASQESPSEAQASTPSLDVNNPPLVVSLEPSVVSLDQDERVTLQLVVRDAPGPYRMSLAMSYDAARLELESLIAAPGVQVVAESIDDAEGVLSLDLVVGEERETAHAVAAVELRALAPGPVPLMLGSGGATTSEGSTLPVAVSDGAVFVAGSSVVKEP
jgi:general secretion pathway protein D